MVSPSEPGSIRCVSQFSRSKNAATSSPESLPSVLGNYVIMRRGDVFAAFAHLAPDSVAVATGQTVGTGDMLGRVGHTGNSTAPHLHFQ